MLGRERVQFDSVRVIHAADMQFQGQSHILSVPLQTARPTLEELQALFEHAYWKRFEVELPEIRAVLGTCIRRCWGGAPASRSRPWPVEAARGTEPKRGRRRTRRFLPRPRHRIRSGPAPGPANVTPAAASPGGEPSGPVRTPHDSHPPTRIARSGKHAGRTGRHRAARHHDGVAARVSRRRGRRGQPDRRRSGCMKRGGPDGAGRDHRLGTHVHFGHLCPLC